MFILTTHILLGEDKTVCGKKKKKPQSIMGLHALQIA